MKGQTLNNKGFEMLDAEIISYKYIGNYVDFRYFYFRSP